MERADSNYISDVCIVITLTSARQATASPLLQSRFPTPSPAFQKQDLNRVNQGKQAREKGGKIEAGDPFGEVVPSPMPAAGLVPLFRDSQLSCYSITELKSLMESKLEKHCSIFC